MDVVFDFIKSLHLRDLNELSVVIRLVLAVICGGIIGIEREHKHRPAGFRTHILICLGATFTTLTSQYLLSLRYLSETPLISDPLRLGAQVIAGMGFIGAGTIIVTKRSQVKGLTTAAGLWSAAIIGLAIGVGYYEAALYATLLLIIAETLISRIDWKLITAARNINIYVEFTRIENIEMIIQKTKSMGIQILDIEITKATPTDNDFLSAIFSLQLAKRLPHNTLMTVLSEIDGIQTIEEL